MIAWVPKKPPVPRKPKTTAPNTKKLQVLHKQAASSVAEQDFKRRKSDKQVLNESDFDQESVAESTTRKTNLSSHTGMRRHAPAVIDIEGLDSSHNRPEHWKGHRLPPKLRAKHDARADNTISTPAAALLDGTVKPSLPRTSRKPP
ncbi:hypothetical protein JR316_0007790 [Psilocybe cubensis]|uniref:Uncharacterized protein n=1 Tax=Psilocybe cubensis TaxID=181762 RepID=A0ACB8GUR5_PSICU|nr:hypothetical protein JR316_0007790 [Psilocybe cubensis]KAH9479204.1 hypothetical protein JR316_0007790 [Psilocybe cubensis]